MVKIRFIQTLSEGHGGNRLEFGWALPFQYEYGNTRLQFIEPLQQTPGTANIQFGVAYQPPYQYEFGDTTLVFDDELKRREGGITLQFGPDNAGGGQQQKVDADLDATAPAPAADIDADIVIAAELDATLSPPRADIDATYDINVYRQPNAYAGGQWAEALDRRPQARASWREAREIRPAASVAWQDATTANTDITASIFSMPTRQAEAGDVWANGIDIDAGTASRWQTLPSANATGGGAWAEGIDIDAATAGVWRMPPRCDQTASGAFAEARRAYPAIIGLNYVDADWRTLDWAMRWAEARQPPVGIDEPPDNPVTPEPPQYVGDTLLKFCAPLTGAPWILRFGVDPCRGGVVPIKRVYIVSNSARITRVADGADIPVQSVALSIDVDSFAWSLRASLAGPTARQMIGEANGAPVEVDAHINGETWRVLIDGWSRSREFANHTVNVTGRSLAAYLAAPYATPVSYTETQNRLAQQLALRELPTGWTLDWQVADWLVPAGVWTYAGQTPIESIGTIAAAAGGYLQADMAAQSIHALKRYPHPYWEWAAQTPDITLPLDVITQMGSDWQPAEDANAVYISGREQGVLVNVKRTGTAGNLVLPTIVDPLITDVDPARGRGTAELAATGQQSRERVNLPLDSNIAGLLKPGTLAEVSDTTPWRGLVRATSINAQRTDAGGLSVRQQVELERHHKAA